MSLWRQSTSFLQAFSRFLSITKRDVVDKDSIIRNLTAENERLKRNLRNRSMDLIDQVSSRRQWQERALAAEKTLTKNPFVVLLIDGDGYIFRDEYIGDREEGAVKAGSDLCDFFRDAIRTSSSDSDFPVDFEVVIRIYVNKSGLASAMVEAGIIDNVYQLDSFFVRLTQSHPLIDVVDCGGGKERVDEKIREQYRHYAAISNCQHISIACCHDSGYVAFLEKFQKYAGIEKKTSLFAGGSQGHASFSTLGFRRIVCQNIFRNESHLVRSRKRPLSSPKIVVSGLPPPSPQSTKDCSSATSLGTVVSLSASSNTSVQRQNPVTSPAMSVIPVNRKGQRVDTPLKKPSETCFSRLRKRTKNQKLCAEFLLNGKCSQGNGCPLDHNQVKEGVTEALRYSMRAGACRRGPSCRKADCYYGHHCPSACGAKPSCEFKGMHGIEQVIADYVPAVAS